MPTDRDLVQIVDAAMAEAVRRSGSWIACRAGCADCCLGPFPITMLDARRLREGLATLAQTDAARATRLIIRARALADSMDDDDPCPALDPATRTCDLYAAPPITCRMFGPAVRSGGNVAGVCELCYDGAADDEIAACVVDVDVEATEQELLAGDERTTSVALAILSAPIVSHPPQSSAP